MQGQSIGVECDACVVVCDGRVCRARRSIYCAGVKYNWCIVCAWAGVQSKEGEASRMAVELRAAKDRESGLSRDLTMAKASLQSVQGMVRDMQSTNDDLLVRLEALEVNMMMKVGHAPRQTSLGSICQTSTLFRLFHLHLNPSTPAPGLTYAPN